MPLILAKNDIQSAQIEATGTPGGPEGTGETHHFFRATVDTPVAPSAYLNRHNPGRRLSPHFHIADQFQIIMAGKGIFGRHQVSPYSVHFSRAYTPYGPLVADKEIGWTFFTLRTRFDPGQQRLPAAAEKLKRVPDRHPWQVTGKAIFPDVRGDVRVNDLPSIKDDRGLFAQALSMGPSTCTVTPSSAHGDGQYVIVVNGSVLHEHRQLEAPVVMFTRPDEPSFELQAGAKGMHALVLNFPRVMSSAVERPITHRRTSGQRKWQCVLCAFAYDEAVGMPEDGIPAGTRWEDVPGTWSCPDCAATKSDFQMVEVY